MCVQYIFTFMITQIIRSIDKQKKNPTQPPKAFSNNLWCSINVMYIVMYVQYTTKYWHIQIRGTINIA